jgi:Plant transposon protein
MSETLANRCYVELVDTIKECFQTEFLRIATKSDMKQITTLHQQIHGVPGMVGSLDCTHIYWKNCPKRLQGSFQGRPGCPTIILECAADYNLWFWHAAFGFPGSLNDINVLGLSPLLSQFNTGAFEESEQEVVPYNIGNDQFAWTYFLADGIYPNYSRFVKSIRQPVTKVEQAFTAWQECARQDIERAFGVLQIKFQILARPILRMNGDTIANTVATCLILHNMSVQDRVCGEFASIYQPADGIDVPAEGSINISVPSDLIEIQAQHHGFIGSQSQRQTGIATAARDVTEEWVKRYRDVLDVEQNKRLQLSLMQLVWRNKCDWQHRNAVLAEEGINEMEVVTEGTLDNFNLD